MSVLVKFEDVKPGDLVVVKERYEDWLGRIPRVYPSSQSFWVKPLNTTSTPLTVPIEGILEVVKS